MEGRFVKYVSSIWYSNSKIKIYSNKKSKRNQRMEQIYSIIYYYNQVDRS